MFSTKSKSALLVSALLIVVLLLSSHVKSQTAQTDSSEALGDDSDSLAPDAGLLTKEQALSLTKAITDGNVGEVKSLLEAGRISLETSMWKEKEVVYPVVSASTSRTCNVEILQLLKEAGATIDYVLTFDESTRGIINIVVRSMYVFVGEENKHKNVLKSPWVPNTLYDYTYACLRWLLDNGADPNGLYYIPATNKREEPIIQSSVSLAVRANDLKMLDFLYEYGVDINEPRKGYQNPLDLAITKRYYDTVRWLLDHGVDIYNVPSANGRPLATYGDIKIKTMFLEMGVDPQKYNYHNSAIQYGDLEFLEKVMAAKPFLDVNFIYDRDGNKKELSGRLAWAAKARNSEYELIVKRLLELGADPCLENSKGRTAYEEARKFKREKNLAILEAHYPESACVQPVSNLEIETEKEN